MRAAGLGWAGCSCVSEEGREEQPLWSSTGASFQNALGYFYESPLKSEHGHEGILNHLQCRQETSLGGTFSLRRRSSEQMELPKQK